MFEDILKTTSSHSHNDQTNCKSSDGTVWSLDNRRDSRDDQDSVTDESATNRVHDGLESTEMFIGNISTNQWHNIGPE